MRIKAYDKIRKNRMGGKYNNLNQGATPVEFVLGKSKDTIRDHTLDGYRRAGSKLVKDNKSSVAGYLKPTSSVKGKKQIGSNLYTKLLQNGGVFNIKGDNTYEYLKTDAGYATRKQGTDRWVPLNENTLGSKEAYEKAMNVLSTIEPINVRNTLEFELPGDKRYSYLVDYDGNTKQYYAIDKEASSNPINITNIAKAKAVIDNYLGSVNPTNTVPPATQNTNTPPAPERLTKAQIEGRAAADAYMPPVKPAKVYDYRSTNKGTNAKRFGNAPVREQEIDREAYQQMKDDYNEFVYSYTPLRKKQVAKANTPPKQPTTDYSKELNKVGRMEPSEVMVSQDATNPYNMYIGGSNEGGEALSLLPSLGILAKNYFKRQQQIEEESFVEEKPTKVYQYQGKDQPYIPLTKDREVPTKLGTRLYKSLVMDLNNPALKGEERNRGEYKDYTNVDGLHLTLFNPFMTPDEIYKKYEEPIKKYDGDIGLIGVVDGKIIVSKYKTESGKTVGELYPNGKFSRTFTNKFYGFKQDDKGNIQFNNSKGVTKGKEPVYYTNAERSKENTVNVVAIGNKDYYGAATGGAVIAKVPETGEIKLIRGSVNAVINGLTNLKNKNNSEYLELYTLDNGTFSAGLFPKNRNITKEQLKDYDLSNRAGGNGIIVTIDEDKLPSNNRMVYSQDTVNLSQNEVLGFDSKSYPKYKERGASVMNTPKMIVLHHTETDADNINNNDIISIFKRRGVSSNVVIGKKGERTIVNADIKDEKNQKLGADNLTTFHAGEGIYQTKSGERIESINNNSLGVEIVGITSKDKTFNPTQVKSTVEYVVPKMMKFNIPITEVTSHDITALSRLKEGSKNRHYKVDIHYKAQYEILKNVLEDVIRNKAYDLLPDFDIKKINDAEYKSSYIDTIIKDQILRTLTASGLDINSMSPKVKTLLSRVGKLELLNPPSKGKGGVINPFLYYAKTRQVAEFKKGGKLAKKKSKDEMPCNKPMKSWRVGKKKVVKGCEDGKERIIHYGHTDYSDFTQHKDTKRRANFRARHNCDTAKSKLTARRWACVDLWEEGGKLKYYDI